MGTRLKGLRGDQCFGTEDVYLVPGRYTASAAVRANDGTWHVKTSHAKRANRATRNIFTDHLHDCAKIWRNCAKIWLMSKISDALFSKATKAVLANIFLRPEGMHLRALTTLTGLGSASAQRELATLSEAGILIKENIGKVILYKANLASPIYAELSSIIQKVEGVAPLLKAVLDPFRPRIERAFIYGSVAKNEDTVNSDIDLLVIGNDIGSADLYPELVKLEQLGRKISLSVYRPAEFLRKLKSNQHFLVNVVKGHKIELIGADDESEGT